MLLLSGAADSVDGAAADGANAFGYRLAVFCGAFCGVIHRFLFFALHAVCFNCHVCSSRLLDAIPTIVYLE